MTRWIRNLLVLIVALTASNPGASDPLPGRIAYLASDGGYWQVWVIDGGSSKQITRTPYEKTRISWYPDGRRLLVNSIGGKLYELDTSTGTEREISLGVPGALDAVVSPDGHRVAFSAPVGDIVDGNEIWILELGTGKSRPVTNQKWLQHAPSWSPDGQSIYFLSGKGEQSHDIWRLSIDGGSVEQLTAGSLYHFDLNVAPNGEVAFSSNRSGDYEVWGWDPSSDEAALRLTESTGFDGYPSWGPEAVLFTSARGGTMNLWMLNPTGEKAERLTNHERGARGGVWWTP